MELRIGPPCLVIGASLLDYVMPFLDGQPAYVMMDGTSDLFLPVFSSLDRLQETTDTCGIKYDDVKQITNQDEFLDSIPTQLPSGINLRIILDPEQHDDGTIRFAELFRKENRGYLQ